MKQFSEDRDDIYCSVFSELKSLGIKVPKVKKFKSTIPKQEKVVHTSNGRIFGVCLCDQEKVLTSDFLLPEFIVTSTSYLKKYCKKEIGLFRKAGSISRQRDLRAKLEKGEGIGDSEPNDVASLLKQWLRELPGPLIPVYLHDLFMRCQSLEVEDSKVAAVLLCCHLLPPEHLHTLQHLLDFLSDMANNSDKNKMGAHNLALIMAPNIFVMGNDLIDKTSGSLVQQHTSIVEILIIHSNKIGKVPPSSSQFLTTSDRYGTDLDLSTDALEASPSKSKKKRRSGPVQDLFSGIRKLVSQNSTPPNTSKWFQDDPRSTKSVSRSASKRKAENEVVSMSPAKKQAIAPNGLTNETLNCTPNSKSSQSVIELMKEKTGSAHSRRKSFGLLRRKDKKRQKSKATAVEEAKVFHTPSPFEEKLSISFQDCLEPKEVSVNKLSPLLSTSDIDRILSKSSIVKKSISDCYLTVQNEEFKDVPLFSTSSLQGCLSGSSNVSSYNLRSGGSTKQQLKRKSEVLIPDTKFGFEFATPVKDKENAYQESFQTPYAFNHKLSPVSKTELPKKETRPKDINIMADTKVFSLMKNNIQPNISVLTCSPGAARISSKRSSSRRRGNLKSTTDSNIPAMNATNGEKHKCENHAMKTEVTDINDKPSAVLNVQNMDKMKRKHSINRQEAFIIKDPNRKKSALSHVKSADPTVFSISRSRNITKYQIKNSKSDLNKDIKPSEENSSNKENDPTFHTPETKRLRRKVRNGSIVRGRPNTIRTGLPSDLGNRFNNDTISITTRQVLTSTASVDNDLFINVINQGEKKDHDVSITLQIQNMTLSSPVDSNTSEVSDLKVCSQSETVQPEVPVNIKDTLSIPKQKSRAKIHSNSDSKVQKTRRKSPRVARTNSFPEPLVKRSSRSGKKLRAVNSSSPRKFKSSSNELEKENMYVQSSILEIPNQNDLKTPFIKPTTSEEVWTSGRKYLDAEVSSNEEVFNKRESIAMILKNNPGHVQAKVHLYDHRNKGSVSNTPIMFCYSTPGELLRDSQSSSIQSQMSQRRNASSLKSNKSTGMRTGDSAQRCKTRYTALPPPPKFVIPDLDISSPKLSFPLKEVTNISNGEDISFNLSPAKNSFSAPAQDTSPVDVLKDKSSQNLKPKRNSYSGHTPYKLPKVFRSESSPLLAKVSVRSPRKLSKQSVSRSPSLITVRGQNISNAKCFNSPVFRTRSALSIEKLRSDQLGDEWHYEM